MEYVKVKIVGSDGIAKGREYTYSTDFEVCAGDIVIADMAGADKRLVVTEINVEPGQVNFEIKQLKGFDLGGLEESEAVEIENIIEDEEKLEIIITERSQIDKIEFNYEDLKAKLTSRLAKYKNSIYDDSAIGLAKKDRKKLNDLKKIVNDKKIEIKNECLKPYDDFETKVKEILGMIDKPVLEIDTQIKNYEEKSKNNKKAEIENYFNEKVGDLSKILSFGKIFVDKWLNVSVTMKSIRTEIDENITRVNEDLEVIKGLNSEFDTELNNEYLSAFDLSSVLRKKSMLEERKKALEELEEKKKQQELERQALVERVKANAKVQRPIQEFIPTPKPENIVIPEPTVSYQEPIFEPELEPAREIPDAIESIFTPIEDMYYAEYRIVGPIEQLRSVSKFLQDNKIEYTVGKQGEI